MSYLTDQPRFPFHSMSFGTFGVGYVRLRKCVILCAMQTWKRQETPKLCQIRGEFPSQYCIFSIRLIFQVPNGQFASIQDVSIGILPTFRRALLHFFRLSKNPTFHQLWLNAFKVEIIARFVKTILNPEVIYISEGAV